MLTVSKSMLVPYIFFATKATIKPRLNWSISLWLLKCRCCLTTWFYCCGSHCSLLQCVVWNFCSQVSLFVLAYVLRECIECGRLSVWAFVCTIVTLPFWLLTYWPHKFVDQYMWQRQPVHQIRAVSLSCCLTCLSAIFSCVRLTAAFVCL